MVVCTIHPTKGRLKAQGITSSDSWN